MKIPNDAECTTNDCTICDAEDVRCVVTGGGPVCVECFDDSDSADWEPVDSEPEA